MLKHGSIISGLVVIAAAGILSACHVHNHGGGTVYRPQHRTVPAGPVETRTTTVQPHYDHYRYVRYRRDRYGRYYRHTHGDYYLARDGRYYRHQDVRYRRDRHGRFHRDRHGQYYMARDGRYYGTRDGRLIGDTHDRHGTAPARTTRQPVAPYVPGRINPPAHGLHDTQPGHLRQGSDPRTRAANAGSGIMDKAGDHPRFGTPGQRPISSTPDAPQAHQQGPGKAVLRPPATTSSQHRGKSRPTVNQPKMSSGRKAPIGKLKKHPAAGNGILQRKEGDKERSTEEKPGRKGAS